MRIQSVYGVAALIVFAAGTSAAVAGNAANLMFPLDATWSVVPFSANGPQGSGPASGVDPLQRNDDDFAQAGVGMPAVPFNFDLYGTVFTGSDIFINNNGNLSFGAGFTTFTATGFPVAEFPMVAPFWGDVDTRNLGSGVVYYKYFGANTLVVTWDNVGYYFGAADKTNTFQVAISDGSNPAMGLGNNVCFSYDDMQWTTGDASGGVGGFGGVPATVGVNKGDGVNFFQIGRFDRPGNDYNGPNGVSGVDFLDGLDLCFNVSGVQNQPPIAVGVPPNQCYLVNAGLNEELHAVLQFIGPEINDTVFITGFQDFNGAQAAGLAVGIFSPGNPALLTLDWVPDLGDVGVYNFEVTFEDSFEEQGTLRFKIEIIPTPGVAALAGIAGLIGLRRRR